MFYGEDDEWARLSPFSVVWANEILVGDFAELARSCGQVSAELFVVRDFGRAYDTWDSIQVLAHPMSTCFRIPEGVRGRKTSKSSYAIEWLTAWRDASYRAANGVDGFIPAFRFRKLSNNEQRERLESAWGRYEEYLKILDEIHKRLLVTKMTWDLDDESGGISEIEDGDLDLTEEEVIEEEEFVQEVETELTPEDDPYEPEVWDDAVGSDDL